ncbi:MAG: hypothetical protein KKG47_05610 [Proteobacteria bacterium]|nr:hypothetical protein [Pseudomonadota bacterium]MBU1736953.1 hypothetical protein [Pseudomonadota bacterium]
MDFADTKESKPDELFAAWLEIPDEQRNKIDAEFQEIFELSCEKGFQAIMDEAEFHLIGDGLSPFAEKMSELSNHYERAMITFLDHKEFWKGATRFYHADTLPYWRKQKNMSNLPAAVDDDSIMHLADLIRNCRYKCHQALYSLEFFYI